MTDNLLAGGSDLPPIDPNKKYLEELVGENKKFKDLESLARGKYESDTYIPLLERKLDQMREDYKKLREDSTAQATLKDLIEKMSKQPLASSELPPANEVVQPKYNPDEIKNLITSEIKQSKADEKRRDNYNLVKDKLTERYGSNYPTVLSKQIDELGITGEELTEMAMRSPNVVIKTLGLDTQPQQEGFQSPPRSNLRNDSFSPKGKDKRTWSYYQELKKTNPNLYNEREINLQMQKDYAELGSAFEDGDFHAH